MIRVGFVIGGYPPEEHKRRADVALSYSTAEIQVGIVDVAASPNRAFKVIRNKSAAMDPRYNPLRTAGINRRKGTVLAVDFLCCFNGR